ncbi:MAG: type II toxin-antitoxin system HicA family toxin [Sphaerochaetaceae bacterium]
MSSRLYKLIKKMQSQPNNISFEELCYVLEHIGCVKHNTGGSHFIFTIPGTRSMLSVPKHKPVKATYVKKAFAIFALEEKLDEKN